MEDKKKKNTSVSKKEEVSEKTEDINIIIDNNAVSPDGMASDFEEKESKKNFYYVRLSEEFIKGETMTMLEKINKTAYWMFIEMVFETNRTAGLIKNNSSLLRRVITNTERNIGHKLTIDEIVKALNTLIGFGLIKKRLTAFMTVLMSRNWNNYRTATFLPTVLIRWMSGGTA